MDFGVLIETFCQTPVFFQDAAGEWQRSPVDCRLPPYDRFISDRAFGQKKRLLQTPGGQLLPEASYYRVGSVTSRVYMVESVNEDLDEYGDYLNVYMIREAPTAIEIHVQQKTKQASGASRTEWVMDRTIWGDFDRYGVIRSSDLPVDYTSYTVSLPPAVDLPLGCRLKMDGQLFAITETFSNLELKQLRVRGINGES